MDLDFFYDDLENNEEVNKKLILLDKVLNLTSPIEFTDDVASDEEIIELMELFIEDDPMLVDYNSLYYSIVNSEAVVSAGIKFI